MIILKHQIENSTRPAGLDTPQSCIWIIICQESLGKIFPAGLEGYTGPARIVEKINAIKIYLKQKRQTLPEKVYQETVTKRLEYRRQQNIQKCLEVNRALTRELRSTQSLENKNSRAPQLVTQLTNLLAEQEIIKQELAAANKNKPRDPKER